MLKEKRSKLGMDKSEEELDAFSENGRASAPPFILKSNYRGNSIPDKSTICEAGRCSSSYPSTL